jgi:SPP1 family predicted phage head-tail adaptor
MITIPLGLMDRCITLQYESTARGADGSFLKSWASLGVIRAAYNYRSGGEKFEMDQETAVRMVTWTIRYIADVDETWRIKHGSDLYDIVNVEELGRKKYLKLHSIKKTVYQEQ